MTGQIQRLLISVSTGMGASGMVFRSGWFILADQIDEVILRSSMDFNRPGALYRGLSSQIHARSILRFGLEMIRLTRLCYNSKLVPQQINLPAYP